MGAEQFMFALEIIFAKLFSFIPKQVFSFLNLINDIYQTLLSGYTMIKALKGTSFSSVFKVINIAVSSASLAMSVYNTYNELDAFAKEVGV